MSAASLKVKSSDRLKMLPHLKLLLTREQIQKRLIEMAADVAREIDPSERPIAVVVLQGAFVFAADLLRLLPIDFSIDLAFLRCQSYGAATRSSGRVMLLQDVDPSLDLRGRTVLLLDDILDTGLTIRFLADHLKQRGAGRVRVAVLLRRHRVVRPAANGSKTRRLKPDFTAFKIGSEFVVGYGLDFDGKYRHLPDLATVKSSRERRKK